MKITILGSGSSYGTPMLGGFCHGSPFNDERNLRLRSSALVHCPKGNVLIDVTPDIRQQTLKNNIRDIDAICLTHGHADHISGIWEMPRYAHNSGKTINIYASEMTMEFVVSMFGFMFIKNYANKGQDNLVWHTITEKQPFECCGVNVLGLNFPHNGEHKTVTTTGYRFNNTLYSTDISGIKEENAENLKNLECWVIDCNNGYACLENGHLCLDEIIALKERFNPEKIYLTHIQDDIDFAEFSAALPEGIELVYDGMVIG